MNQLIFLVLTGIFVPVVSGFTQTAQPAQGTCGCNYMPLCNVDLQKSYAGKVYKGVRFDDESVTYFNCDNGVLTAKWSVREYDDYNEVYNTLNYTRILLKEKEKEGVMWTESAPDGKFYTRYVVGRHASLPVGQTTYTDVIQVRQLVKGRNWRTEKDIYDYYEHNGYFAAKTYHVEPSVTVTDFYYARGKGEVKRESITGQYLKELSQKHSGKPLEVKRQMDPEHEKRMRAMLMSAKWQSTDWKFGVDLVFEEEKMVFVKEERNSWSRDLMGEWSLDGDTIKIKFNLAVDIPVLTIVPSAGSRNGYILQIIDKEYMETRNDNVFLKP